MSPPPGGDISLEETLEIAEQTSRGRLVLNGRGQMMNVFSRNVAVFRQI
jgi:hypothetical protein